MCTEIERKKKQRKEGYTETGVYRDREKENRGRLVKLSQVCTEIERKKKQRKVGYTETGLYKE